MFSDSDRKVRTSAYVDQVESIYWPYWTGHLHSLPQKQILLVFHHFTIVIYDVTMAFVVNAPTLWNMFPSSVKLVANIAQFRRHLKKKPLQLCLSTIATSSINQSDDNWICLLILRSISLFVLVRFWAWIVYGFRRYRNYLIIIIIRQTSASKLLLWLGMSDVDISWWW